MLRFFYFMGWPVSREIAKKRAWRHENKLNWICHNQLANMSEWNKTRLIIEFHTYFHHEWTRTSVDFGESTPSLVLNGPSQSNVTRFREWCQPINHSSRLYHLIQLLIADLSHVAALSLRLRKIVVFDEPALCAHVEELVFQWKLYYN